MEQLKKKIRSMVVSNPERPMTISQLDKYFKCHEGYHIPYEKYGFKHLDALIRSMSDCVQLDGLGCSSLVLPVLTPKSNHIREMVEKQQSSGNKRKAEPSNCKAKKVKFDSHNSTDFTPKKVKLEPSYDFTAKKVKLEPTLCTKSASNDVRSSNTNYSSRSGNEYNNAVLRRQTMAELKKIIHAIVISNPGRPLTVTQLAKDFKYFEGRDIPYWDHGFQHLDVMLQTIPYVVKLTGRGPSALVYPVASERSNHIGEMVKNQKNTNKSRFNKSLYFSRSAGYYYYHSSHRRPHDNSQIRWAQNSYRRNGYTCNGNGYYGNLNHHNGNFLYGTHNYRSIKPSYSAYGYNANNVPGHSSYGFNETDPFHVALLSFYQAMQCNNQANNIPYNRSGFSALYAILKPNLEVAQVDSMGLPRKECMSNNYNFC